jgi:hypothetical protein
MRLLHCLRQVLRKEDLISQLQKEFELNFYTYNWDRARTLASRIARVKKLGR